MHQKQSNVRPFPYRKGALHARVGLGKPVLTLAVLMQTATKMVTKHCFKNLSEYISYHSPAKKGKHHSKPTSNKDRAKPKFLFLLPTITMAGNMSSPNSQRCSLASSDCAKSFLPFPVHLIATMSYTLFFRVFISLVRVRTSSKRTK